MMGVAIDGATHIYGDIMSVIKNTSKPESTLNKKSNSVCYHAVRESVTMMQPYGSHPLSRKPSRPYDKSIVRKQMSVSSENLLHNIYDI